MKIQYYLTYFLAWSWSLSCFGSQQKEKFPTFVTLEKINYILPYYYTSKPYYDVYQNATPDNQQVMNSEFKGQLSISSALIPRLFGNENLALKASYTQLSFWQLYAPSQYFRETNYEPALYLSYSPRDNWLFTAGVDHQSNGRGGELERSWNRLYGSVQASDHNWLVQLTGWGLIFQGESSSLHNPDIEHFLGHERLLFAYKALDTMEFSLEVQNVETAFDTGSITASMSFPLNDHLLLYLQYFRGYGQSLIEYDHKTEGYGIGFAINTWIWNHKPPEITPN